MHRIDTSGHVGNMFDEGDPGVPTPPTQVDSDILNAFQEEIANAVEGAGITLVKNINDQLFTAIDPGSLRIVCSGAGAPTLGGGNNVVSIDTTNAATGVILWQWADPPVNPPMLAGGLNGAAAYFTVFDYDHGTNTYTVVVRNHDGATVDLTAFTGEVFVISRTY